jgi:ubiquinone/menaquinone biosynthesis C-methylase UbiE
MTERVSRPINWKEESERFDGVADLYEAHRPSYPTELIDDIISFSGIQPGGWILEIGSGTGKATILFARRGFSMLCLEPGQNLLAVAIEKLKPYQQVTFERIRFEDWPAGQGEFDLVVSAQAFHWVPKEVRDVKAASVLKKAGHIALFWHMYPPIAGAVGSALSQVYWERAPELVQRYTVPEQFEPVIESRARSLGEGGYFEAVEVRTYPWSARYTRQEYVGLLNTYSDHLRLSDQRRGALFEEVAEVIEQYGGYIEKPYLAVLYMARKKSAAR